MAEPRKKTASSRKKPRTPRKGSPPAEKIDIPFRPAPDFRYLPCTGTLVRANPEGAVITFYVDDNLPVSQSGKLVRQGNGFAIYEAGPISEEMCRWLQVGVRLSLRGALALADLLRDKVHEANPALTEDLGSTSPEEAKKQ